MNISNLPALIQQTEAVVDCELGSLSYYISAHHDKNSLIDLETLFDLIFEWASSIWRDRENNGPIQENNNEDE